MNILAALDRQLQHWLGGADSPVALFHITAVFDALIAVAALIGAVALFVLLLRAESYHQRGPGLLISAILLACGFTHTVAAAGIWVAWPEVLALGKAATAVFAVMGVVVVVPLIPKTLAAPSAGDLAEANRQLQAEVERRGATEMELRLMQAQLEARVSERTADLVSANERLEREIRDRRSAQDNLQHAIREREALLREVHHRVKNNLQMMTSLLNLQIRGEPSDAIRQKLREMQSRINALSLVHKKLYGGEDLTAIDLAHLLGELCTQLGTTYRIGQRGIAVEVEADSIVTDMDHAIPFALLVTEAVTNALRHAFPDDGPGRIEVSLQRHGTNVMLRIADDGIGLASPDLAEPKRDSGRLGFTLMRGMARQLDGELELRFDRGVEVRVTTHPDNLAVSGLRKTA